MGIRTKQIDLEELYGVLDERYSPHGKVKNISVPAKWNVDADNGYFYQTLDGEDFAEIIPESKLIIQPKYTFSETYEENLENENLFSHIVRVVPGEGSITFYSNSSLEDSFDISILIFN